MSENIGFGVKGIGQGVRGHVYLCQQLAIGDTTTVAMARPNYEPRLGEYMAKPGCGQTSPIWISVLLLWEASVWSWVF